MTRRTVVAIALVLCGAAAARAAAPADALSLDEAYRRLPAYTYEHPRALLRFLEAEIQHASADPARRRATADRLAAVLADPKATPDAKRFVCRWLPLVADDAHVPVLARLLKAEATAEMARQALQAIPGEASLKVLRDGLRKAKGEAVVGFITALGARRDAASVDAIAAHLKAQDAATAGAAADALGAIGTPDAAKALAEAATSAQGDRADAIRDARLRCAQRLAEDGRRDVAVAIQRDIFTAAVPVRYRIAAMAGLVAAGGEDGWAAVERALADAHPTLRAAAIQAGGRLTGGDVTEKLVDRLPTLSARDQALLLAVLADRGDPAARPGVLKRVVAGDEAVRAAAVRALAAIGTVDDVRPLVTLAAGGKGAVAEAARESLARLDAAGADGQLIAAAGKGDAATRAAAIRAMADRQTAGASAVLLKAAAAGETAIRLAGLEALAEVGAAGDYPSLVDLLAGAEDGVVARAAEKAAVAVGRRRGEGAPRLAPVRAVLAGASTAATGRLLGLLPALGDVQGLGVLEPYLQADDAALRDAAVRALVVWPDSAAGNLVLKVAKESENRAHRALALRAYMRLLKQNPDAAARVRMLTLVRPLATTAEAKKLFLAGLSGMREAWALEAAEAFLEDPQVKAEAKAAVDAIRGGRKKKPPTGRAAMPPADPKRLAARREELGQAAPDGFRLACYMDCGPQTSAGEKGKPGLRVMAGAPYAWGGAGAGADVRYGTIVFTGREVAIETTGLDAKRTYRVGFSWWDYDHNTRAQSVWAAPRTGARSPVRLLPTTKLPSGAKGEKPAEKTIAVPHNLSAAGSLRLLFRNEATPNAVVSEVWLLESEATHDAPPPAAGKPQDKPAVALDRSASRAPTRVLMVTGIDHPGHKWRETGPVLRAAIEQDPRLAVDVVEDPAWLESGDLRPYKAIVHHWMNWKAPAPGAKARANFARFVREGGGLVLVHFGCGAWQDWPEFVQVAGRVWDPKLRAHDPRGPFTVDIVDADHPTTRGLKAFEVTDELYTCLAGKVEVHVLATATSKVDKKDYPMAFVLTAGKGRVFHCVLGHDVKALEPPSVRTLYRRGTAWAAGLEPKP